MPRMRTIFTALITTAIGVAIIWRVPQLKQMITGESS